MLLLEYWKNIPGFDRYQASYSGKIRHLGKVRQYGFGVFGWMPPQFVKARDNGYGYLKVCLAEYGKQHDVYAHILIAKTFIPNPENLPEINHKNTIKGDNSVSNLEWCTRQQNISHAVKMGRFKRQNINRGTAI